MARHTPPPDENRCEALLTPTDWIKHWRTPPYRCFIYVHYEINGKRLCGRHAALEALALLIKEGRARHTPPIHEPGLHRTGVVVVPPASSEANT